MSAFAKSLRLSAAVLALAATGAQAGGPLTVCDDPGQTPIAYTPTTVTLNYDLGTLGGSNSFATEIDETGAAIGWSQTSGNAALHACLYSAGQIYNLGNLGGTAGMVYAVNKAGVAVGGSNLAGDTAYHACRYGGGRLGDLGTLGGSYSCAFGINDAGIVVGQSSTAGDAATPAAQRRRGKRGATL